MKVPNVAARFSETPGKINTLGPSKGEHTIEILKQKVKLSDAQIEQLKEMGVI